MAGIGASILVYVVGHHGTWGPMAGMVAAQGAVADQQQYPWTFLISDQSVKLN